MEYICAVFELSDDFHPTCCWLCGGTKQPAECRAGAFRPQTCMAGLPYSWVTFCGESDRNLVGIGDFMVYFDAVYQGTIPRR